MIIRKALISIAFAIFIGSCAVRAELQLDQAPLQVGNAILFKDHVEPSSYYYMPNTPRIATWPDGTPKLTFLKYTKAGKEESKGGILHFFVTYGLEAQELNKIRTELAKVDKMGKLKGPVIFKKGTFMVVSAAVGEGGVFTRKIIGEGKAPLISGSEVSVSISVTPEGAAFLDEALKHPTYPVSVRFDMTYEGLTPKYQAKVKINWDKTRSYFEQYKKWRIYKKKKFWFWSWYVQKGTGESTEIFDDLKENGSVQIDITGEDENLDALQQTITDTIMKEMFEMKMDLPLTEDEKADKEGAAGGDKGKKDRPYGVSTTMKTVKRTGNWELNMMKRLRQERETGPMDASIGDTLRKFKNNKKVVDIINLDDPDLEDRTVYAILDGEDFDNFGKYINFVTVSFRKTHLQGEPTSKDVIFNAQTFSEKGNMLPFVYPRLGEGAAWINYEYKTNWSFMGGVKVEGQWKKTDEPAIALTPPYRYRTIDILADEGNVTQHNIKLITVTIKNKIFSGERERQVKIVPQESLWQKYEYNHEEGKLEFSYQITWLLGDGRKVTSDWKTSSDPFIYALYAP
ncbi:MAG: hypothetical protein AB1756_08220 [Acidobacteriota bacterium]